MTSNLQDIFSISAENDSGRSYVVFRLRDAANTPLYYYQMEMIGNNPVPSIISPEMRRKDDEVGFYFNVKSKIPLATYIKNTVLSESELAGILQGIFKCLVESRNLFLYEENFIIDEEFIYIDPEKCISCMLYLPANIETDFSCRLRDFTIGYINKTLLMCIKRHSNCMNSIIHLLKNREADIDALYKLVTGLQTECGCVADPQDVQLPEPSENLWTFGAIFKYPHVKIIISFQVLMIAMAILLNILLKRFQIEIANRYILICLTIIVPNLLLLKYPNILYIRKNRVSLKKTKNPVSEKPIAIQSHKALQIKYTGIIPASDATILLCDYSSRRAYLVFEKGEDMTKFEITGERIFIGRNSAAADFVIDEKSVGRLHAEMINKEGKWFIVDNHSKNGTYLNGERLIAGYECELKDGSILTFANREYKFVNV